MKRGFDKERVNFKSNLAGLGAFQTELMEYSTGFRHGAAARNVPVDELITGTQFRQIPGLGFQVAPVANGVLSNAGAWGMGIIGPSSQRAHSVAK